MKLSPYKSMFLLILCKIVPLSIAQAADSATLARELIDGRLSIQTAIPQFEKSRQISKGPNCWNMALFLNRIVPGVCYTDAPEFRAWLNSPLCKKVATPRFGDIIALRDSRGEEVHGMVYLGGRENQVFSKNGCQPCKYQAYKLQQVNAIYQRKKGDLTSDAYRCIGISEFLAHSPDESLLRPYHNAHVRMARNITRMHFSAVSKLDFKVLAAYSLRSQALADAIARTMANRLSGGLPQQDDTIRLLGALRESFKSINWSIAFLETAYLERTNHDSLIVKVQVGTTWLRNSAKGGLFFSDRPISQLTTGEAVYIRQTVLDAIMAQLAYPPEVKKNFSQAFKLNQPVVITDYWAPTP